MGDRVAVLRNGELQQLGPPRALYDAPANIFVAGFIGAPTMNFLRVDIVAENGGAAAVAEGFRLALPPELLAAKPRLANICRPQGDARRASGGAEPRRGRRDRRAGRPRRVRRGFRRDPARPSRHRLRRQPARNGRRAGRDPDRRAAPARASRRHRRCCAPASGCDWRSTRAASISSTPKPNMRSDDARRRARHRHDLDGGGRDAPDRRGAGLRLAPCRSCSRRSPASPRPTPANGGTTPARRCARRSRRPSVRRRPICVTGMVPALVLLDEAGRPLRRSLQQNDARCVERGRLSSPPRSTRRRFWPRRGRASRNSCSRRSCAGSRATSRRFSRARHMSSAPTTTSISA